MTFRAIVETSRKNSVGFYREKKLFSRMTMLVNYPVNTLPAKVARSAYSQVSTVKHIGLPFQKNRSDLLGRSLSIYNLLKIDKPNHRRERNKGHITRAEGMWQSNWRQSRREREESTQRSAKKNRLGKRPAEDPGEPTQRQSEATSVEKTLVERDKRQPAGSPPDLDHSRCPHASE